MAGGNWELPIPVFRTSEGADAIAASAHTHAHAVEFEGPATPSSDNEENLSSLYLPPEASNDAGMPMAPMVQIEEQPYLSEQLTAERIVPVVPESAAPARRSAISFMTVLVVLFTFLAALLAVIYYIFFIRQPADTTF